MYHHTNFFSLTNNNNLCYTTPNNYALRDFPSGQKIKLSDYSWTFSKKVLVFLHYCKEVRLCSYVPIVPGNARVILCHIFIICNSKIAFLHEPKQYDTLNLPVFIIFSFPILVFYRNNRQMRNSSHIFHKIIIIFLFPLVSMSIDI